MSEKAYVAAHPVANAGANAKLEHEDQHVSHNSKKHVHGGNAGAQSLLTTEMREALASGQVKTREQAEQLLARAGVNVNLEKLRLEAGSKKATAGSRATAKF